MIMEMMLLCALFILAGFFTCHKARRILNKEKEERTADVPDDFPDILGMPKHAGRQVQPSTADRHLIKGAVETVPNFDHETMRDLDVPVLQEGPDEAGLPDWEEEEEEFKRYGLGTAIDEEIGLATGVTYEELATMGRLMECQALVLPQKKVMESIASKIDGTELLALLESAAGDASRRIAMLLDRSDAPEADSGSSLLRNNNEVDFDIGDYV